MSHSTDMRFNRTFLATSIAAIGLAAAPAQAADEAADELRRLTRPESEVEVGVGNVSNKSFSFGDYTGLDKNGGYGIANVSVVRRGDDDARYLEIVGRNLGLSSRSLSIEGGEQGNFGLRFEYSELPKLHSDTYQSPYSGLGTSRLTKPTPWTQTSVSGAAFTGTSILTTQNMTNLAANMKPFEVRTDRKDLALALTKMLPAGWDVELNFKRDKKDGAKLKGAPLQTGSGGSRGTLLVPDPIDYTTDNFNALARYIGDKLQVQIGYQASLFKNAAQPLVFDNLFLNPVASTVGGNMLTGKLGTMPDNQFHQVSASVGYTFSKDTRLSGSASVGRMTQDAAFLPYISTNPNALAALPVNSLNGKVDTKHFDIKLNSKLTHSVKLTAGYRYDDKDNRTAVNKYVYQSADNTLLSNYATNANQSTTRWNTPLSKTKQVAYADLDFHLAKSTTLNLGYDYDDVKHTNEATTGDKEHTYKVALKHHFGDTANAGIGYSSSDRNAAAYNGAAALIPTYSAVYLATLCVAPNRFYYNGPSQAAGMVNCTGAASATGATTPWLDTPALRKYFLADRKREKVRAFANIAPTERLDLQIGANYFEDKYPDTVAGYGLVRATGSTVNFDANFRATDAVTATFFATVDDYDTRQNAHNGSTTNLDRQQNNATFKSARAGVIAINDRSVTAGLGIRVKAGEKFDWGGDIIHTNTTGTTRFSDLGTAIAATVLPLPDTKARLNRLELFGNYKIQKHGTISVKYALERLSSVDWAYDGQTLTSSNSFVGSGITSPSYRVHAIGVSYVYKFQ